MSLLVASPIGSCSCATNFNVSRSCIMEPSTKPSELSGSILTAAWMHRSCSDNLPLSSCTRFIMMLALFAVGVNCRSGRNDLPLRRVSWCHTYPALYGGKEGSSLFHRTFGVPWCMNGGTYVHKGDHWLMCASTMYWRHTIDAIDFIITAIDKKSMRKTLVRCGC